MPFLTTKDITLHYDIAGLGPPLCLINGYRQNKAAWPGEFIAHLAKYCSVISFDNRGTGLSGKPEDGYGFDQQACDVIALLDHLGHRRFHLLGFSMGGAIAQEVAIRFPDRVSRLVLFGTFCGGLQAEQAPWSVLRKLFITDGLAPAEAARQAWPVTYTAEYLKSHAADAERQMQREVEHPTPAVVAQKQMEALRKFDSYRVLPSIRATTLVATGAQDLLVMPRNSSILATRIPHARLELLAGLGHRAIWEAPEEIAEFVGDFVTHGDV
jgi:pimeloyl-ACP methyl ester carboxylesterase